MAGKVAHETADRERPNRHERRAAAKLTRTDNTGASGKPTLSPPRSNEDPLLTTEEASAYLTSKREKCVANRS